MLEIFEKEEGIKFGRNGLFIGDKIEFNDKIDNIINSDKYTFTNFVNTIYAVIIFRDKLHFKYNECRRLIEEIKKESDINSTDVFDL